MTATTSRHRRRGDGKNTQGPAGVPMGYRRLSTVNYDTPTKPTPLRTFYVNATTGSDTNNGTSGAPFKTTSKINSTAQAGDRFICTGTFNAANGSGRLGDVICNAGTSTDPIQIVGSSPGAATFDGGGPTSNDYPSVWMVAAMDYWWFEDVKIASSGGFGLEGLLSVGGSDNHTFVRVEWVSCYPHQIGGSGWRYYDCTNSGTVGSQVANTGDGFFIEDGSNNGQMIRWTSGATCFHSVGTCSLQNALDAECTDWVVAGCDFSNTAGAGGLILNGRATRWVVENNLVHDISNAVVGDASALETRLGFELEGTDIVCRDNRVWNVYRQGISIQGRNDFGGITSPALRIHVHNNTIYNCGGPPIEFVIKGDGDPTGCIVENNIGYNNHQLGANNPGGYDSGHYHEVWADFYGGGAGTTTTPWTTTDMHTNIFRNNFFYQNPTDKFLIVVRTAGQGGNIVNTRAEVEANYPNCANNSDASPSLTDPANADFSIPSNSPCVDAGNAVVAESWKTGDVAEPYEGAGVDVGAYEAA